MKIRALLILLAAFALSGVVPYSSHAATTTVTSLADLQSHINSAIAGDTIIVANGTYTATSTLTINRVGTATAPITIAAETIGGVEINGPRGFTFSSPATHVILQGFVLKHASAISVPSGTHFVRLTRNVIELTIPTGSDVSYLNISGDDVEIDRNELRNKSTLGEMLDIAGSGTQVARRLWVHHNYFHDFTSPGGNGAETIRWGLSGLSLSNGFGLCEYNLFVRCEGENEMISNKSSSNIYRYNTVLDCPGGEISQRHGNDCLYYGNYMRNTQGMRIYGDRHQIFSNYFEGNSIAINMGNGDGDVYNGALLTAHDRPDDNVVSFNTLVNNDANYEMGGRTGGLGATHTTFANNLIVGGAAISISSTAPYTNPVWAGNIIWNTSGPGDLPAGSYTNVDPLLAKDANGVCHLQAGSPAIDGAIGTYAAVMVDQDGQLRTDAKDTGADEFSSASITARPLTTADVGPNSVDSHTPPTVTVAATGQIPAAGDTAAFFLTATDSAPVYRWQFNGSDLANATGSTLTISNIQPVNAGLYTASATSPATVMSSPVILGLATTSKVIGAGSEVGFDILHANHNIYDQVLLQGRAASVTADAGQVLRMSYIDLNDDIVQVEFAGAGTLSLVLDSDPSAPAPPTSYNQPSVSYVKGHAGIVITGADESTNVSVFTVGRKTAVNQSLFRDDVTYDGVADIAFIAILSTNGKFGGVRTANASYFNTRGITGIYAPGVQFTGPVFVGNLNASDAATPVLIFGSAAITQINGGDLFQSNDRAVQVSGITQLMFVPGSTSHGAPLPAQSNRARFEQDGVDVTKQIVVNPGS